MVLTLVIEMLMALRVEVARSILLTGRYLACINLMRSPASLAMVRLTILRPMKVIPGYVPPLIIPLVMKGQFSMRSQELAMLPMY